MSKSKKSITVDVPVKWIKGDKVWIIEEDDEWPGSTCDKCGHADYSGAYSVAPAKVVGHAMTTDEAGKIFCVGYQLAWRKRKEYLLTEYVYNTSDEANLALAKMLSGSND